MKPTKQMNSSMSHLTENNHCICSQIFSEKIFRQLGIGFHRENSTADNDIDEEGNGEGNNEDVVSCITDNDFVYVNLFLLTYKLNVLVQGEFLMGF